MMREALMRKTSDIAEAAENKHTSWPGARETIQRRVSAAPCYARRAWPIAQRDHEQSTGINKAIHQPGATPE